MEGASCDVCGVYIDGSKGSYTSKVVDGDLDCIYCLWCDKRIQRRRFCRWLTLAFGLGALVVWLLQFFHVGLQVGTLEIRLYQS
jgi:hypothetical protein